MHLLAGVGVLVTRPEHQADTLCRLLERRGATAYRLPALCIVPVDDLGALAGRLAPLERFELIVFTSANAVRFGAPLLDSMPAATLAAIGPATARALAQCGHRVVATPLAGFDSASLLEHPLLAEPRGRRILIVKGLHGRELLEDSLLRRGAEVAVADVYARARATPTLELLSAVESSFTSGSIHIVTATSVDIASALLELATATMRRELDRVSWLVPSERVEAALRGRGIRAPIVRAASADDHDLVAAVETWHSRVSDA